MLHTLHPQAVFGRGQGCVNILNHTASTSGVVSTGSRPGAPCGGLPLSVLPTSVQQDKPADLKNSGPLQVNKTAAKLQQSRVNRCMNCGV